MLVERHRADWQTLRYFWAVAEMGSFAAAARTLGVATSTLTRAVEEMEARLGVNLLHRTRSGVTLTDDGEEVLDQTRTMARAASVIDRLAAGERRDEGVVQIVAPDGVAAYALAPAVADFQRAHPKIAIEMDCGFWPTDPLGGRADIVVQYDEVTDPDAVPVVLGHMHFCLFAAPAYIELYGAPPSLAEAAGHRYLHHPAQNKQKEVWSPKYEAFQGLANVALQSNSSGVIVEAVRAGAGIATLPTGVVRRAPELVMLGQKPVATLKLWMSHQQGRGKGRTRLVMNWLREQFDSRRYPWYRPEFIHPDEFKGLDVAA
jgi:DNA-binding transcriptional LysR family regulator